MALSLIDITLKVHAHLIVDDEGVRYDNGLPEELELSDWIVSDLWELSSNVDEFIVHIWEALDLSRVTVADDHACADDLRSLYVGDPEDDHRIADSFICKLLTELGFTETVEAWDNCTKWYA